MVIHQHSPSSLLERIGWREVSLILMDWRFSARWNDSMNTKAIVWDKDTVSEKIEETK
jgi:hypothetical protein